MKTIFLLSFLLLAGLFGRSQTIMGRQIVDNFPVNSSGTTTCNALTWLPQTYTTSQRSYPLIISLHGTGESGTTITNLSRLYTATPRSISGRIADGWNATAVNPATGVIDSFIVVSPQAPSWSYNYDQIKYILPAILSKYRIDLSRIYLTGLSAGGAGTYSVFGSRDISFIKKFAAMATASNADVDGVNGFSAAEVEASFRYGTSYGVSMWTIVGENDFLLNTGVKYHDSTNALKPARPNKLTVLQGVGHSAWQRAYDTSFRPVINYYGSTGACNNGCSNGGISVAPNANGVATRGSGVTQDSLNLFEWFLSNKRSDVGSQQPSSSVSVNAGNDMTVSLPVSSLTLSGSVSTTSGIISSIQWTQVNNPGTLASIQTPNSSSTSINNLSTGTYLFRLTAVNSDGKVAYDDVQVVVNAATPPPSSGGCGGRSYTAVPSSDGGYYNVFPLAPGDTLYLDGRYTYSYVYLNNRNGTPGCPIVITNKNGVAKLRRNQFEVRDCKYLKISGNNEGLQYGINIQGRNSDTLWNGKSGVDVSGKSKCIEISNLEIRNMGAGIKIAPPGECDDSYNFPNWAIDSISIHDNKIVRIWNEGMYLGNTSPDNGTQSYSPRPVTCNGVTTYPRPPRLGNFKIYNNIVDSTGRGGIQLASASVGVSEIYNNTIMHSGMNGDDAQGTAISTGAYTKARIYNNRISNTYTWGIALLGASGTGFSQEIYNNTIDSSGYMQHYGLATIAVSEVNLSTRTVSANTLIWPHNIFMKSVNNYFVDSTRFSITSNIFMKRKGNWNIGMLDTYNTFHKTGNVICSNINVPDAPTSISREGSNPINYGTSCTSPPPPPPANRLPVVNAGPDQTITLPVNSVTLNGSASDADGIIVTRQWNKISGPASGVITTPAQLQTNVSGLVQGSYQFELVVTDNQSGVAKDTLSVTVNASAPPPANQLPVVNAGADQTITLPVNSVTLNGSASDADGSIVTRQWNKISGPASGVITTPAQLQTSVTGLVQGSYQFELVATDNQGGIGKDTVNVTVNPAPPSPPPVNQLPVVNAGADQTITLPVNSVTLNGSASDADGSIISRQWNKISGPASGAITTPAQLQTSVTGLVQGSYQFELVATDNQGGIGKDTVNVTVNPAPPSPPPVNQLPVVNAGTDQTITLPVNSVTLNGSASDADGNIVSRQWNKISGPASGVITTPAQLQTSVTGLVQGLYQFELVATDNQGGIGRSRMTVIVIPSPVPNQAPIAVAGDTIILWNKIEGTLDGTKSRDNDGRIIGYKWRQISGPSQAQIESPESSVTPLKKIVEGQYQIELSVQDDKNAWTKDTVYVIVKRGSSRTGQFTARMYPNPVLTSTVVNIEGAEVIKTLQLIIVDRNGRIIRSESHTPGTPIFNHTIRLEALQSGGYTVLALINNGEKIMLPFIKIN